jgi:hypothetical protein
MVIKPYKKGSYVHILAHTKGLDEAGFNHNLGQTVFGRRMR